MNYYIKRGNTFSITDANNLDIRDHLPAGNYLIQLSMEGYYLEQVDAFLMPKKLYGNTQRVTDRVMKTFEERPNSLGVAAVGEKGSGKSLLSKNIAIEAAKLNMPTLIVNNPFHGDGFSKFIQDIDQPCVVFFDEFEKIYDAEQQEAILTLFDGVFPSKKLFLVTCNDKYKMDRHMMNRPGRLYYMLEYKGLSSEFIEEFCTDALKPELQIHIDQIINIASMFTAFNFDMLKSIVEDMNRFDETPQQVMEFLNAKPEEKQSLRYKVSIMKDGVDIDPDKISSGKETRCNPVTIASINLHYCETRNVPKVSPKKKGIVMKEVTYSDDDEEIYTYITLTHENLVKMDMKTGVFVFDDKKGHIVKLVEQEEESFDYLRYLGR